MPSECTTVPTCTCIYQPRSSQKSIFWGFYGSFITQECLIKSVAIGDRFNCQALLVLGGEWGWIVELNVTNLQSHCWFSWQPAHPQLLSKSHLINITRGKLFLSALKKLQGFQKPGARSNRDTDQTYSYYKSHYHTPEHTYQPPVAAGRSPCFL